MNYYRVFSKIYKMAAKKMCLECQEFIPRGAKILDLGCGSGIVTKTLQDFFQAEVIGVDIEDKRIVDVPFQIIDGQNLPFKDEEFEICFISYVLHHSENPQRLLKEAKRVSKKIIIYEDLPEGILSRLICKIHGTTYSLFFKNKNHSFKSESQWEKIFKEIGLIVLFKRRINHFPPKKELFVLGV